jgi:hypothetical protein
MQTGSAVGRHVSNEFLSSKSKHVHIVWAGALTWSMPIWLLRHLDVHGVLLLEQSRSYVISRPVDDHHLARSIGLLQHVCACRSPSRTMPSKRTRSKSIRKTVKRTFQCAVVGGPVTSPSSSSSTTSLPALLSPRRSLSKSSSVGVIAVGIPPKLCDFALSKLFSLLCGGVSGARGRSGISFGLLDEGSVGRKHAGVYNGCLGIFSWRTCM